MRRPLAICCRISALGLRRPRSIWLRYGLDTPASFASWRSETWAVVRCWRMYSPRFFRPQPTGRWGAVDDTDEDWLDRIYADRVLVTQLDGDPGRWAVARRDGSATGVPTSSSSQPTIMAVMLSALAVEDGHRVLE